MYLVNFNFAISNSYIKTQVISIILNYFPLGKKKCMISKIIWLLIKDTTYHVTHLPCHIYINFILSGFFMSVMLKSYVWCTCRSTTIQCSTACLTVNFGYAIYIKSHNIHNIHLLLSYVDIYMYYYLRTWNNHFILLPHCDQL